MFCYIVVISVHFVKEYLLTIQLSYQIVYFFIQQLSTDHVVSNENEQVRLSNLGLDIEQIQRGAKIGNHESTRSIGDYTVKGGYKDFDLLR